MINKNFKEIFNLHTQRCFIKLLEVIIVVFVSKYKILND
jgi:hypothetical protein